MQSNKSTFDSLRRRAAAVKVPALQLGLYSKAAVRVKWD